LEARSVDDRFHLCARQSRRDCFGDVAIVRLGADPRRRPLLRPRGWESGLALACAATGRCVVRLVGVEDDQIRALVTRLARPHRSGGEVIERAAIFAEGGDFAEVMDWIIARGGTAEAGVSSASGGLHAHRLEGRNGIDVPTPLWFVLPSGVLVS
jgi:hypothetical protein